MYEYEKEVAAGRYPQWEMLENVSRTILANFKKARLEGQMVRDSDLKRWAIEEAAKYGHPEFKVKNIYIIFIYISYHVYIIFKHTDRHAHTHIFT